MSTNLVDVRLILKDDVYRFADAHVIRHDRSHIDALITVLTNGEVTTSNYRHPDFWLNQNIRMWVCKRERDHLIVGMGSLHLVHTQTKVYGVAHDVVILPEVRGRGIGEALVDMILTQARLEDLAHVELTSHPSREAANSLYRKKGFELADTNFYRLKL